MRMNLFIVFIGVLIAFFGVLHIENTQKTRTAWSTIESNIGAKNELSVEWNKLKLEESMLITGVLLDQDVRERLGMVVPSENAVVYIVEQNVNTHVVNIDKSQGNIQ